MSKASYKVPLIPLKGLTVFPNMVIHFDVGRTKSLKAIEEAMLNEERILLITQKDSSIEDPSKDEIYEIGTVVHIKQIMKLKPPTIKVLVEGETRAKIIALEDKEYMEAEIEEIEEEVLEDTIESEALVRTVGELFEKYASLNAKISSEVVYSILGAQSPSQIMDLIVANIPLEVEKKQEVLECTSIKSRIFHLIEILEREVEVLQIQNEIKSKVQTSIDKNQKEYYLREQLKVIQDELGDKDGIGADVAKYQKQMEEMVLPAEVEEKLLKEIDRLQTVSTQSPESGVIRTYIETILQMPWGKETLECVDVKKGAQILDEDHYGLEEVKERVLDFLAVRQFSKQAQAPIVCLVGPPGVGKTSIAKSVARATGRNEVRISLGGIRDEAEIRGHRRTYVGAMPGRFVKALTQATTNNPVMILDEIDKMMGDFRGDPAAALLEVLDPAQNNAFRDHYLELPVDLSKVMFIATANDLSTIPRPLLDRMEVISVGSYTTLEKIEIAKTYLIPKQLAKHGLNKTQCKIKSDVLETIIEAYTREAGVRNLERAIATICRKVTRELLEQDKKTITITSKKLKAYLGEEKVAVNEKNKSPQVGVVRGLAWTAAGGDTLSIEVNVMKGKGVLELTGNMGDVMKESARAAVSYIRAKSEGLALEEDFYVAKDIHVHIPEGAVPKDGPSAGITMVTAIISALKNRPIRNDIAMTGEVTIRGNVLAIGGLKEKLLAAKAAGIFEVIVPKENKKSIEALSKDIIEGIQVHYAETMDDVLKHVFA